MKTDRELLELAAKAEGIEYSISPHGNLLAHRHPGGGEMRVWNPLTDDGDALRLAVQLELKVMVLHDTSQPKPWLRIEDSSGRWTHAMVAEFEADPCAATRRAITRAAAHIQLDKEKT